MTYELQRVPASSSSPGIHNITPTTIVNRDYGAWPARICIVKTDGTVHYYSERGPRGFRPDEANAALGKLLEPSPKETAPTALQTTD